MFRLVLNKMGSRTETYAKHTLVKREPDILRNQAHENTIKKLLVRKPFTSIRLYIIILQAGI